MIALNKVRLSNLRAQKQSQSQRSFVIANMTGLTVNRNFCLYTGQMFDKALYGPKFTLNAWYWYRNTPQPATSTRDKIAVMATNDKVRVATTKITNAL